VPERPNSSEACSTKSHLRNEEATVVVVVAVVVEEDDTVVVDVAV
jgi:hypothetical protein